MESLEVGSAQIFNAVDAIKLAYLSRTPVVWLVTGDKEVASEIVKQFVADHYGAFRSCKLGCSSVNLKMFTKVSSDATSSGPSVFYSWSSDMEREDLMRSIENFVTVYENMVSNAIVQKCTAEHLQNAHMSLAIIASPDLPPESWLSQYIDVVYVKPLSDSEIKGIILKTLLSKGVSFNDEERIRQLVVNLRGFSSRKIAQAVLRCVLSGFFDYGTIQWSHIIEEIRLMKRQMLDGFVGLKWIDLPEQKKSGFACGGQIKAYGSLDVISSWLNRRRQIFEDTEKARKLGYDIPKGVLITGIPGTGKSMMAKETAKMLNLPLIALDMGDLQEGLVGASEKHMVNALRKVEAMAPCVLWIDEIEKAFSGANSGNSDGGVMRRMFGKFLTWMQEKTAPCFVFATSNDISVLPPELFRSERFDDKYFSFMPMADECASIFSSLIKTENDKFVENNPDNEQGFLFPVELTRPDVWKSFLNSYAKSKGLIAMDGNNWQGGKIPQCKLFTGADISMVVKLVKFKLLDNYNGPAENLQNVISILEDVLKDFMPYGQTNLKDIASCFVKLSHNRFKSASSSSVVNFDDYNVVTGEMNYEPGRYKDEYDQVLYAAVTGSINYFAKEKDKKNVQ